MKLTVKEQKELISDEAVRQAFLRREDISKLSPEAKEERWEKHKVGLDKFRQFLTNIDCIIL